jgi:hypothetical protein
MVSGWFGSTSDFHTLTSSFSNCATRWVCAALCAGVCAAFCAAARAERPAQPAPNNITPAIATTPPLKTFVIHASEFISQPPILSSSF